MRCELRNESVAQNDLMPNQSVLTTRVYADDTSVFYYNDDKNQNRTNMLYDISLLRKFYRLNRLTLYLAKN